jgi:hypothetical protein
VQVAQCEAAGCIPQGPHNTQGCEEQNRRTYLYNKMNHSHPYETRQATEGGIRFAEQFGVKSNLSRNSFCCGGTLDYNRLPVDVRAAKSIKVFKYKLKKWVKSNIPVD